MSQLGVLGMPDDCFYIKSKVSSRCFDATWFYGERHLQMVIDGSTDRCGIAIVTNQRALLSRSNQPERKLGRLCILCVRRENELAKTAMFAQWYMVHC